MCNSKQKKGSEDPNIFHLTAVILRSLISESGTGNLV